MRSTIDSMYALLAALVHGLLGSLAALAIAPHSIDPTASSKALWSAGMVSALLSTAGLAATARYLSRRVMPIAGAQAGLLCGLICSGIMGMTLTGMRYSLVLYLVMLVPTLVAVLLATLLDARGRQGSLPDEP